MRKALNENPVVQAALIGVLVLGVGLYLLMRMGGSSEPAPDASATTTPVETQDDPAAAAAAPTDPAPTQAAPAPAQGGTAPPVNVGGGAGSDLNAGPGLPKDVAKAYNRGDSVVLLIVTKDGIDDDRLKELVEAVGKQPDATLFLVDVRDVSRYSRITEGVDLDRTPALVVVRPKSLTDGPMPTAVVSYGFRGGRSVEQALDDALYKGPQDLPYYPR